MSPQCSTKSGARRAMAAYTGRSRSTEAPVIPTCVSVTMANRRLMRHRTVGYPVTEPGSGMVPGRLSSRPAPRRCHRARPAAAAGKGRPPDGQRAEIQEVGQVVGVGVGGRRHHRGKRGEITVVGIPADVPAMRYRSWGRLAEQRGEAATRDGEGAGQAVGERQVAGLVADHHRAAGQRAARADRRANEAVHNTVVVGVVAACPLLARLYGRRYLPGARTAEGDEEQGAHTAGTAQLGPELAGGGNGGIAADDQLDRERALYRSCWTSRS